MPKVIPDVNQINSGRNDLLKRNSCGVMVSALKISEIRDAQLKSGYFDCFGRASSGYCDQLRCTYYTYCMEMSRVIPGEDCF